MDVEAVAGRHIKTIAPVEDTSDPEHPSHPEHPNHGGHIKAVHAAIAKWSAHPGAIRIKE